jgi:hypothetical protein
MNSRKLTTLVILCLTILSADLLSEVIVHEVSHFFKHKNPYRMTAISMAAKVLVFYPAFQFMEEIVKKMAGTYVGKAKGAAGGGFTGLLVAFVFGLGLLYGLYLKVLFHINIIKKFL